MELVDKDFCKQWCSENGIEFVHGRKLLFDSGATEQKTVALPERYLRCASLAISLSYFFDEFRTEGLFWMQDFGFWSPEFEDIGRLFWRPLRPEPHRNALREYPGHLCEPEDGERVRGLLILSLVNQWDSNWIQKDGKAFIIVDHDGRVTAATRERNDPSIVTWLESWEEGGRG